MVRFRLPHAKQLRFPTERTFLETTGGQWKTHFPSAMLSLTDRLVVLDRGRILETGTHRELMETRGRYWAMVEAQRILTESRTLSAIREG